MSWSAAAVIAALAAALGAVPVAGISVTAPDRASGRRRLRGRVSRVRVGVAGVLLAGAVTAAARAAGRTASLPGWLLLALVLVPLAIADVEHHRLPDRLLLPGGAAAVASLLVAAAVEGAAARGGRAVLAGAVVLTAFLALTVLAPGALGMGDVKLLGLLAVFLGWQGWGAVLDGILAGFVIGAGAAAVLLATRRAHLRSRIAFGPSLMAGALLVAAVSA